MATKPIMEHSVDRLSGFIHVRHMEPAAEEGDRALGLFSRGLGNVLSRVLSRYFYTACSCLIVMLIKPYN